MFGYLTQHQRILQAGREAHKAGLLWSDNPYGYPPDDETKCDAQSWSWGWLQVERETRIEWEHQRAIAREANITLP